jgi:biopolymer transport protein ExbB
MISFMVEWFERLIEVMQRGGPVMWPLLFMSILALALSFERLIFWVGLNRSVRRHYERFVKALRSGDREAVRALAAADTTLYGELAGRLAEGGDARSVSVEVVESQRPRIERYMLVFSTIVTSAPMLGILGTVLGIIRSFELLGAQETITDPRDISSGIAEALITTAFGLVVALIALGPFMALRGQVERAFGRFEAMSAAATGKFGRKSS